MNNTTLIPLFSRLGELFKALGENRPWTGFTSGLTEEEYDQLQLLIRKEQIYNPWFTESSVRFSLSSLGQMLEEKKLNEFTSRYKTVEKPHRIGLIMAGNIPMVGFHDMLCTLLSGNIAVCKLSSDDRRLLPAFVQVMKNWNPEIADLIVLALGPIGQVDAVVATGSNNSSVHFEQYFGKYPHIFRRNRTSVAVLTGEETNEELQSLGNDMFQYFGLGCRNVSKILAHKDFNIDRLFEAIVDHGEVVHHHKYANNYDYNRTVYLMNSIPFLDNNFCMIKEDEGLHSPLSVFYLQRYESKEEVEKFLEENKDGIQAVVGKDYIPFGAGQKPTLDDFADGVDTMKWLMELH